MDALKELFSICNSFSADQQKIIRANLSSRSKKSLPQKIFERLCNAKKYDSKKLKDGIPNFTLHLHYLKSHIEQNLHLIDKDVKTQVQNKISAANFLYLNGSYKWANKIIVEAKKMAQEHLLDIQLIQINDLERNLSFTEHMASYQNEEIYEERDVYVDNVSFENKYIGLAAELYKLAHTKDHFKAKRKKASEISKNNLLSDSEISKLNLSSQIRYYEFVFLFNYVQYNAEEFAFWGRKMFDIFQNNKHLQRANKIEYLRTIVNYSASFIALKQFEEIPKAKKYIDNFPFKEKRFQLYIFEYYTNIYFHYLLSTSGEHEEKIAYINECTQFIKENENVVNKLSKKVVIVNIAFLYFQMKKFDDSRVWINEYFHQFKKKSELLKDFFYQSSEMLSLYLYFEENNFHILKKDAKSYLKKTKRADKELYKIESAVIHFFINTPFDELTKAELIAEVESLLNVIIDYANENEDEEKYNDRYLNHKDWFRAKLEELKA